MGLDEILKQVELFQGLDPGELHRIAQIFREIRYAQGDLIATQGSPGDALNIISEGFVEIAVQDATGTGKGDEESHVLIHLGQGQIFGEMSLVDRGPLSASVRAISTPTVVQVVNQEDFFEFCEHNTRIGYLVMRNIAADLSFKLRKQNLVRG